MRTVFVVGCPRSGTSWVRNILGAHPGVHAGPESHLYPTVHGVLREGRAWDAVIERYDALAFHGGAGPHRWIDRASFASLVGVAAGRGGEAPAPDVLDAADAVVAGVITHYRARRRLADSVVLVEKTPDHIRWASRILDRSDGSLIVEVRRDGRDVCVSMERRAQRVAWPPKERREQIMRWTEAVSSGLRLAADPVRADRWHVVRFEDLSGDRDAEIRRLFAFAEIDDDPALVARVAAATDISRQVGTGDGEHVRTGAVGDWRRYFDRADCDLFEELAGDVQRQAGYA